MRLRDVLSHGTATIDYTYDFGDSWEHELVVSDVRQGEPGGAYLRFIAGERDCPPEDCGGIPGFYEMLKPRADPANPDHEVIASDVLSIALGENGCGTRPQAVRRTPARAISR